MKYLEIANHYKNCFLNHGDCHLGVDWPKYEDTLTRYKIMYDLLKSKEISHVTNSTLLDFGCGLGHFLQWGTDNNSFFPKYSGLDINFEFVEKCKEKFPNVDFYDKDILIDDQIPNFDYIICNGTFTEKLSLSNEEMMIFFKSVIIKLWNKCNVGISFNLMSKQVDWEKEDLFHVSLDELAWFLKNNLSRNFIIRNDYKLYEFTTYVYKS